MVSPIIQKVEEDPHETFRPKIEKSYLESSPDHVIEEKISVTDDDELYIHKESFFKSKMIVTLKLKDIELWVMDFKGDSYSKAQIL